MEEADKDWMMIRMVGVIDINNRSYGGYRPRYGTSVRDLNGTGKFHSQSQNKNSREFPSRLRFINYS